MRLDAFLISLRQSGRVRLAGPEPLSALEIEAAHGTLRKLARIAAMDLPEGGWGGLPPSGQPAVAFNLPAAGWAAAMLYRACQFLAYREFDSRTVLSGLAHSCPELPSPAVCFSVDVVLRYLPDVIALARGLAPDDPLVRGLGELGRQWPLTSVGMDLNLVQVTRAAWEPPVLDIRPFFDDPVLRQLYIDRIIEREDAARLDDPAVREAVAAALGMHPDLSPRIAAALTTKEPA